MSSATPRKRKGAPTSGSSSLNQGSPSNGFKAAKLADDRIVIAVDFGTTFSGVAYAFNVPGKTAEAVSVLEWPGKSTLLIIDLVLVCAAPY